MLTTKYKRIKIVRKAAGLKSNRIHFKKKFNKKITTKTSAQKIQRRIARKKARLAPLKPPSLPLNVDFYNVVDGVYGSYWAGKLMSTLQRNGKKKIVAKHFYRAATFIKLSLGTSPLLLLLETLDRIKPTFRLRNYIIRRTIIKEYPIVVLRPRQFILAVHWLKEEIRVNSGSFGSSLSTEIAGRLIDFKLNPKKNNLVKKRNEYTRRVIKAQFNVRYNFK